MKNKRHKIDFFPAAVLLVNTIIWLGYTALVAWLTYIIVSSYSSYIYIYG